MKATLKFNLDDQDDEQQFHLASHAQDFFLVLFNLEQRLRNLTKYSHDFKSADEALETIRQELNDSMIDRDISFDILD